MAIITMTTDFGLSDGYVGAMKGVILSIAPDVTIVDITHDIQPHAISQAAFVVASAAPYFPEDTIHLIVVDPGVGSERRPLVLETKKAAFVAPDNGVLTLVLQHLEDTRSDYRLFHLTRRKYWLDEISRTFHGRDIFAPVAAHLANGVAASKLGKEIDDPVRLDLPRPQPLPTGGFRGRVIYVDRFGNLVTNIPAALLGDRNGWCVEISGHLIPRLSQAYADVPRGHVLALIGSTNMLEIAVREGSAALMLGLGEGAEVLVTPMASKGS